MIILPAPVLKIYINLSIMIMIIIKCVFSSEQGKSMFKFLKGDFYLIPQTSVILIV